MSSPDHSSRHIVSPCYNVSRRCLARGADGERPLKRTLALLALLGLTACAGASKGALAAANVGIGVLASGVSRAAGGCYATCTGTDICNTETGFCDSNPCDRCSYIQHCETNAAVPRCVDNPVPTSLTRKTKSPDAPLTLPFEPVLTPVPESQRPPLP